MVPVAGVAVECYLAHLGSQKYVADVPDLGLRRALGWRLAWPRPGVEPGLGGCSRYLWGPCRRWCQTLASCNLAVESCAGSGRVRIRPDQAPGHLSPAPLLMLAPPGGSAGRPLQASAWIQCPVGSRVGWAAGFAEQLVQGWGGVALAAAAAQYF